MEEMAQEPPGMGRELTSDQVERLDAVGPFVELGNARVAHILLHAVLADVAVAAQHLHADIGGLEAEIGRQRLDHRRHQGDEIVGVLAFPGIGRSVHTRRAHARPIPRGRGCPSMVARMVNSIRLTSGWTMIGSAALSGYLVPVSERPCRRSRA